MKNLICLVVVLALAGSASASLTDGLVGAWKFDEGAGLVTADYSGNGHTGSLTGFDEIGTPFDRLPDWATDTITGVSFASGNCLDLRDDAYTGSGASGATWAAVRTGSYQTWGSDSTFSVTGWVKHSGTYAGNQCFASQRTAATGPGAMNWQMSGAGAASGSPIWTGFEGPWATFSPDTIYTPGVWEHWAFVYDGAGSQIAYINGVPSIAAAGGILAENVLASVNLGGSTFYGAENLDALVDEYSIYSRMLSATEVSDIMNNGVAPEPATICLLGLGGLALLRKKRS